MAFRKTFFFPADVFGPVDFWEFRRLAAIFLREADGVPPASVAVSCRSSVGSPPWLLVSGLPVAPGSAVDDAGGCGLPCSSSPFMVFSIFLWRIEFACIRCRTLHFPWIIDDLCLFLTNTAGGNDLEFCWRWWRRQHL